MVTADRDGESARGGAAPEAAATLLDDAIVLESVSKRYDTKEAARRVSLRVPRGSVFGLIGPNGAGKTTTLKIVATLIKADAGRVEILSHDLSTDVRSVRRLLGYMPDQFGAFPGLTCEEYLQFFGRAHRYAGAELRQRIEAVLDLTDLERVRDEMTTALSTGMKQRLSLAKTLLHDPEVLILDEPASGLDPRARIEIRSLLEELGRMGKTILISSHILADLEEICSDVAIMEEGAVVWSGALGAGRAPELAYVDAALRVPPGSVDGALAALRELECVHEVSRGSEGRLEARVDAGCGNRVLRALVEADVEVLLFKVDEVDLEALFLRRTRGIVS